MACRCSDTRQQFDIAILTTPKLPHMRVSQIARNTSGLDDEHQCSRRPACPNFQGSIASTARALLSVLVAGLVPIFHRTRPQNTSTTSPCTPTSKRTRSYPPTCRKSASRCATRSHASTPFTPSPSHGSSTRAKLHHPRCHRTQPRFHRATRELSVGGVNGQ